MRTRIFDSQLLPRTRKLREFRPQVLQRLPECGAVGHRLIWDTQLEDEQRHRDGKNAVGQRIKPGLWIHLQNPLRVRYKPRASVSDTPGGEDANSQEGHRNGRGKATRGRGA
jgi:hypothetical protein